MNTMPSPPRLRRHILFTLFLVLGLANAHKPSRRPNVRKQSRTTSLFDEPYKDEDSRHFDVSSSSTFTPEPTKQFDLSYADGTELKGFNGHDVVHIGHFHGVAPFGLITDCNSPDFNGVDGILGFGLPKPGSEGKTLPRPILWALTDKEAKDSNAQELHRKFSFFSTDDTAELQLGGYDPETCTDTMLYTPSLSSTDFIVGVTSLTYGHPTRGSKTQLLKFNDPTGEEYLPAIMDSGTSCLVIPGDKLGGKLKNSPFDDFTELWDEDTSFWVTIGGKTFEIPYSSWFLAETNQTCVQPAPDGMEGILIGDVFFREYMVEFDMEDEKRPVIGIAALNKKYRPIGSSVLGYYELQKAPRLKLQLLKGEETMFPAEHSKRLDEVDQIPIFNKKGTQYFMDLEIGTPKQPFTVIFDTGSAVFGIFTKKDSLPESIKSKLAQPSAMKVRIDTMNTLMQWDPRRGGGGGGASSTLRQQGWSNTPGGAVNLAMAAVEISPAAAVSSHSGGATSWLVWCTGLLALANAVAAVMYVRTRRRAQAFRSGPAVCVESSLQYGAVSVVLAECQ